MSRSVLIGVARRVLVLGASAAVIVVAALTVQLAAQWRTDSAPLDTVPVSMSSIDAELQNEVGRSADLTGQTDAVASRISELQAAISTANSSVTQSAQSAQGLKDQLGEAQTKLTTVEAQLQAAQQRLDQLNAAAARQAAINARATKAGASSAGAPTPRHDDDD